MKGPAGYGRYDDDPAHVGCPYARSDMSPCVARDGRLALAGDPPETCVCCGNTPEFLAGDLAEAYDPARALLVTGDPVTLADEFAELVREATEPGKVT
jgi:hypothetical protein